MHMEVIKENDKVLTKNQMHKKGMGNAYTRGSQRRD